MTLIHIIIRVHHDCHQAGGFISKSAGSRLSTAPSKAANLCGLLMMDLIKTGHSQKAKTTQVVEDVVGGGEREVLEI